MIEGHDVGAEPEDHVWGTSPEGGRADRSGHQDY